MAQVAASAFASTEGSAIRQKAFELSERGIKPGLTVVLPNTQAQMSKINQALVVIQLMGPVEKALAALFFSYGLNRWACVHCSQQHPFSVSAHAGQASKELIAIHIGTIIIDIGRGLTIAAVADHLIGLFIVIGMS